MRFRGYTKAEGVINNSKGKEMYTDFQRLEGPACGSKTNHSWESEHAFPLTRFFKTEASGTIRTWLNQGNIHWCSHTRQISITDTLHEHTMGFVPGQFTLVTSWGKMYHCSISTVRGLHHYKSCTGAKSPVQTGSWMHLVEVFLRRSESECMNLFCAILWGPVSPPSPPLQSHQVTALC